MTEAGKKILVIDDELQIRRFLRVALEANGYSIIEASNGKEGIYKTTTEHPDCIILDLGLPDMEGMKVLQTIREWSAIPIIILSVRDEEKEKVAALESGADDYVTKPFSTRELIARIRTAVRRVRAPIRAEDAPIEIGEIRLEPVKRTVIKRGQTVHLTRKEFDILHCLMSRAGRVVTYARLLTAVWGADCREEVEYLRTFVRQLRKKIEDDPSNPRYLLTDVYVGYRFADAQMFQEEATEAAPLAEGPETAS